MAAPSYDSHAFTPTSSWDNMAGPSTVAEGDLLIAFIIVDETQTAWGGSATAWPTISGWSTPTPFAVSAGGDCSGFALWKIAGAGDVATGTPVTYTSPELRDGTSAAGSSLIVRVTGADATTPIDAWSAATTASGATSIPLTAVTTTGADRLLLSWAGVDESSAAYDPYWAHPPTSGWTAIIGTSGTSSGQGDSSTYIAAQWKEQASAGSTGTVTMSTASENDAIAGWLVAIRPAAGSPPAQPAAPSLTVLSDTSIQVDWSSVATATSYIVKRDGSTVYTGAALTFTDTGLAASTEYTYTVTASNAHGDSAESAGASATTDDPSEDTSNFDAWAYFEDGAATTNVVAEGNFTTVGTGATYDDTVFMHGAQSARYDTTGDGAMSFDVTGVAHFRLRTYFRVSSGTQTGHMFLCYLLVGGANQADLQIRNTGGGQLWNRWGFSSYTDSQVTAYTRDEWRRIDYEFSYGGGNDTVTAHVYDPLDDTVVVDTLTVPSFNLVEELRVGTPQSGGLVVHTDSLALRLDGVDPGPYGSPTQPSTPTYTVWDGSSEVAPLSVLVWDGAAEVAPSSSEVH